MPVALSRAEIAHHVAPMDTPIWMSCLVLAAAGLFVTMLVLSYGVDLSPGFF